MKLSFGRCGARATPGLDFLLYSPVVPPGQSGQAVILARILPGYDPDRYALVSNRFYGKTLGGTESMPRLTARHFEVTPITAQPCPGPSRKELVTLPYYLGREVHGRTWAFRNLLRETRPAKFVICTGDFYDFTAAAAAARAEAVPYVPYFFDDYAYQSRPFLKPLARYWERRVVADAAALIVTNEAAADEYRARYARKSHVVPNAYERPADCLAAQPPFDGTTFNVVFAGSIYNAHYDAFHNLLAAAPLAGPVTVRLHLFSSQSQAQLETVGVAGGAVLHHGYRPQREVDVIQRAADVLFLPLAFRSPLAPLLRTASPGKMAEYLATGRPILVHAPADSFVVRYFRKHECGLVVDQNDPQALAEALRRLAGDAGLRARLGSRAVECFHSDFTVERARAAFTAALC